VSSATSPEPDVRTRPPLGRRGFLTLLVLVVALLAGVHLVLRFGPAPVGLVTAPVVAGVLVLAARRAGLTWDELGLGRRSLRRGLRYAVLLVGLVAAAYTLTLLVPMGKAVLTAVSLQVESGRAWLAVLVLVPVGTVLVEEIAFRGVLLGMLQRHRGAVVSSMMSSVLFAAWHVLPSLRPDDANPTTVQWTVLPPIAIAGIAVAFTCLAGVVLCEIRRRSGSLLASAGLHWAVNGLGIVLLTLLR
jgi:membrane protease YdiL (CAAX protease family)